MMITIEMKMIVLWILMFIALIIHHLMIKGMIKEELNKLKKKRSNPDNNHRKVLGNFIEKHKDLL